MADDLVGHKHISIDKIDQLTGSDIIYWWKRLGDFNQRQAEADKRAAQKARREAGLS